MKKLALVALLALELAVSGCGTSGAVPGLSFGIAQRFVAERLAGHGLTPKRYVTEWDGGFWTRLRTIGRDVWSASSCCRCR